MLDRQHPFDAQILRKPSAGGANVSLSTNDHRFDWPGPADRSKRSVETVRDVRALRGGRPNG